MSSSVDEAVSRYGADAKAKLANPAISGEPEDQLRNPLETLIKALAAAGGLPSGAVQLIGETSLSDLKTRPDFAVSVSNALIGFIEVKAPGKGADPRRFRDAHDKDQWDKLKALPNLLYTDGNAFSLWRNGEREGKIVTLDGDVESAGADLKGSPILLSLVSDFLGWTPIVPNSARKLAEISARLCRLLRDEVLEQMDQGSSGLTELAKDWRKLLFPEATDAQFADGYAQAVTFGLLVARARGIALDKGIDTAARELRKTNSLIGTALGLLTDDAGNQQLLKTSVGTLTRVLDAVNWSVISKKDPEAWLYFYQDFLAVYDNALRRRTGSYYTPPEVVEAMVRMADDVLRGPLFSRKGGFASSDVTVADPATGTGTFILGVLGRIAKTVETDQGAGAVPAAIEAAAKRIFGFEFQFGPFAVAQLRIVAELQALMETPGNPNPQIPNPRLYITDTLGNPFLDEEWLPQVFRPIAESRREANEIKKTQPITVVIGNPPYKEKAEGMGGWIERGSKGLNTPLQSWHPPPEWGVGAHTKHLKNLYVYFWRWATWKVFGTGNLATTGRPDRDEEGIICFITVAGFLNGPGFQKMRDDLRRTCSRLWVIDCSPEGHQPPVSTRIFQGVQQPVCIVLAARERGKSYDKPAEVLFRVLPKGPREEKFAALSRIEVDDQGWSDCPSGWRDPFLPEAEGLWGSFPALKDLFDYSGSGVMPGRTWVVAPDKQALEARWARLLRENDPEKKELLFHPHIRKGMPGDKHIRKSVANQLTGHNAGKLKIIDEQGPLVPAVRYGFRSLDRHWIIPDARLINQPNPTLWNGYSERQVFLTGLERAAPKSGPAITFTELIPDLDHYKGSFGGRVFPLWRDRAATEPNIHPDLVKSLAGLTGRAVGPEDVMAYLGAVMAHPAFTARFKDDLVQPGLRVPLTADGTLFSEAVAVGREIVWLHCYGERFVDDAAGRPKGAPRMAENAPSIPADGAIPPAPEPLPDIMDYDPATRRLHVGKGFVENVTPEMWAYEVSGKNVLRQWFSYRRRDRTKPLIGDKRPPSPLDGIQPESWPAEYTSDLIDLLNVLGRLTALEAAQADLLTRICDGPLLTVDVFPPAASEERG